MPFTPPPPLKAGLFGRTMGAPAKPKAAPAAGAIAPPPRPKGIPIEHRIGVQAPAEVIWQLIYDLEGWSRWNPTYPRAAGEIRLGATLDMTLTLPGRDPQEIQPVVLEWVPNEQLHWKLSLMNGLVKTIRYIEIEQLAEASCIVSNGEIFAGVLGKTVVKQAGGAIRRGFMAMNEALKEQAEAAWRARQA
ncbi:SRPBCC domain-containing protein [Phenylobacterium sp.]|jgi:hypothetical protein|uniref:SRPBCC domain-containing protein n=1 Tax=Phenylobacterium sp. TaxID=1871053 RepID=UPI002F947FBF